MAAATSMVAPSEPPTPHAHTSPYSATSTLPRSQSQPVSTSPSTNPNTIPNTTGTGNGTGMTANTNTPMFTQEEVLRFIQAAVTATQRSQAFQQQSQSQRQTQQQQQQQQQAQNSMQPEERIMKPRVHMYVSYARGSGSGIASDHSHGGGTEKPATAGTMITTLELPGLRKSDISITARPNGDLVISGERRPMHLQYVASSGLTESEVDMDEEDEESGERGMRRENGRTLFNELKFGKFQRTFRLPTGVDPSTITASLDDGMLVVCWPIPPGMISSPSPQPRMQHQHPQQRDSGDNGRNDVHMDEAQAIASD